MKNLWQIILLALVFLTCTRRAETPEEAVEMLRKAYIKKDAAQFVKLLTPESVENIEKIIEPIRNAYLRMAFDEKKREKAFAPMAKKIGVPISRLGSLTVEEYIAILMDSDETEGKGTDTTIFPKELLENRQIVDRKIEGDKATLDYGENRKIRLKKTQRGWLIDLDFSLPEANYYPPSTD